MAGHSGDLPTVLDALDNDDPAVRVAALGAAARLGELNADRLRAALGDPVETVRYRAVELVARSPIGAELASELIDALNDPALREVAAFAIGELSLSGPVKAEAVAALGNQAISDDDAMNRESAVAALGALEDGLSFILAATEDVATVRRRAVLALAPFEGPDVDNALRVALDDRDWQVRQAAEDLLA
jgi:HEAT repeat protein